MPKRPRPEIDQVREAMRRHDERVEEGEPVEEPSPPAEEPAEPEVSEDDA
jgi:hypothetical protein